MLPQMNIYVRIILICVVAILFGSKLAHGQTAPANVFTFDENGHGTVTHPDGSVVPLISLGNQPDPFDPGNGLRPLAYELAGTGTGAGQGAVQGDVNVLEGDPTQGRISDLLRWVNNSPQGPLLLVYSDTDEPGSPDLADVGLPNFRQNNQITLPETGPESGPNGLYGYPPGTSMPGFLLGAGTVATVYNFTSDAAVPEPASVSALFILGGALLLRRHRRPQNGASS